MSLFLNSSQEQAFKTLAEYFIGDRDKILFSNQPNLIRTEIGSYFSWSRGNAKGEVETTITPHNDGSIISFNFNFTKEYLTGVLATIIGAVLLYFVASLTVTTMVSTLSISNIGGFSPFVDVMLVLFILFMFVSVMILEGQNVSVTKKKFIDEFDRFVKSLPNQIVSAH